MEWGIVLAVIGTLYLTGWYRPILSRIQQGVLSIGIFSPNYSLDEPIPADFSMTLLTEEGQIKSLSEYKGETILINIWATWCPPCRAELPDMKELYFTEEGQSIRWIMVSLDQKMDKAVAFFDEEEYPWEVYQPAGNLPAVFESPAVPTTFVISPHGDIVVKQEGIAEYNTKPFRELLQSLEEET